MATYNTGSVQRTIANYNANALAIANNSYITIFQASALPAITKISGVIKNPTGSVNSRILFLRVQNNNATGIGFNGNGTVPLALVEANSMTLNSNSPMPGVFVSNIGDCFFNEFVVPAGYFVQLFNNSGAAQNYWYNFTRIETTLT